MSENSRFLLHAQLNDLLAPFAVIDAVAAPARGWARAVREALGMSQSDVAARLKVSRQSVQDLEQAEASRRITLDSLDRLAKAMGCRVVYAIVPEGGSLDAVREQRADLVASAQMKATQHSMRLEGQAVSKAELERQRQRLVDELLRGSSRKLWR